MCLYILWMFVCDTSVLIFRASYDTSAPNAKRKYQDEGDTDEDKVEEYKVRRDGQLCGQKNDILTIVILMQESRLDRNWLPKRSK